MKVGDEVLVFSVNARGRPPSRGAITRIGRTLVDIKYEQSWGEKPESFRIDTQQRNDGYGHEWFKTLEQAAIDERKAKALTVLRAHGLESRPGSKLLAETLEALAAVLEAPTSPGGTPTDNGTPSETEKAR